MQRSFLCDIVKFVLKDMTEQIAQAAEQGQLIFRSGSAVTRRTGAEQCPDNGGKSRVGLGRIINLITTMT